MEAITRADVPGWGVDADRENDPTWPMRERDNESKGGMDWTRPPIQAPQVEILQSIEHVRRPAVVGTSTPPSGVSGAIRRFAFRYSESQWAHWLLLMLADRINVIEGDLHDLSRGRFPNRLAEMGWGAELKHHKRGVALQAATTVAVAALLVGAGVYLARSRGRSHRLFG
jgi:hypothetical protein